MWKFSWNEHVRKLEVLLLSQGAGEYPTFFIYVLQVYNLLRKGAMSKCVRSGTCGEKASIDDTPSRPVSE
jgi:hypothetical protein